MSTPKRADRRVLVAAWVTGVLGLLSALATYHFSDDHFGRISPARQILRYGELPLRDFFDPGYVLTELASAAMQWLFGDNLLGELLLTSSFVAGGAVAILLLVWRATGSLALALVTAGAATFSFRRPYDYDKFLFYPWGLLVCWRYADTRKVRDLVIIAAVAAVAGMFRYDNGLFVGVCAVVVVAATHAREGLLLVRQLALLAAAFMVAMAPFVLFLQANGGVGHALDQMETYARREGDRTALGRLPRGALAEFRVARVPRPPNRVVVRWAPDSDAARQALESRYTLHDGAQNGDPANRTWTYEIDNVSSENLRGLINDPAVADTAQIDRSRSTLEPQESWLRRMLRVIPVVGSVSISWSPAGAAVAVYYMVLAVALAGMLLVVRPTAVDPQAERARVLSAAAITLLAAGLVMRDPVVARIGGVIGPPAVLAAWLWHRWARFRWTRLVATACVLVTFAIATEMPWALNRIRRRAQSIDAVIRGAAMTPPPTAELPKPRLTGMVDYLRRCTTPDDRVLAGWFVPELYYFTQRGFAGGMVVWFGGHWSEEANQRRIVRILKSESVPVAILRDTEDFRDTYRLVDDYLLANYDKAGVLTFGHGSDTEYTVLTRRGRVPTGQDPVFALPCFAMPDAG